MANPIKGLYGCTPDTCPDFHRPVANPGACPAFPPPAPHQQPLAPCGYPQPPPTPCAHPLPPTTPCPYPLPPTPCSTFPQYPSPTPFPGGYPSQYPVTPCPAKGLYGCTPDTCPELQAQQQPGCGGVVVEQTSTTAAVVMCKTEDAGRFGTHFMARLVRSMGFFLLFAALLVWIGAILDLITWPIYVTCWPRHPALDFSQRTLVGKYQQQIGGDMATSFNSYSGFWCGLLMVIAAAGLIGVRKKSNISVFRAIIFGIVGLVFSVVVLALSATAMSDQHNLGRGWMIRKFSLMLAGYVVMLIASAFGVIFSCVALTAGLMAFFVGFCTGLKPRVVNKSSSKKVTTTNAAGTTVTTDTTGPPGVPSTISATTAATYPASTTGINPTATTPASTPGPFGSGYPGYPSYPSYPPPPPPAMNK